MSEYRLLASSPSIDGITAQINRFWATDMYTVDSDTLEIKHPLRSVNPDVRVVKVSGRYRFEMVKL